MLKAISNWLNLRTLVRGSTDNRYALAEACLIGLVSAGAALLLKQGIGWLGGYRLQAVNQFGAGLALPLFGLILGGLAGWCLENLSPAAGGGGIPQVKAALANFPMLLSWRVAAVKTISTILVLGGGLTLGRRGPTVHIGAALAAELSRWVPTSPLHRRQIIAAGAAAGLAAGFNTPIAGVLFVIEELMRDASNLTLETAIIASFIGAVVSRILGSGDWNLGISVLTDRQTNFTAQEIPFFLLLGILAGVLGGLFNRGVMFGLEMNRRLGWSLPWRIGLAGLVSGLIVAFLPPFFQNNAGLRESLITGEMDWQTTAMAFVAHFFLTMLASGSGAPGGLFAPALVLGSALGYLVGIEEVFFLGIDSASKYALIGMGAFFSAVVRVPVTAIVIVFELTTDFNLVLPLMVVSIVAYLVGEVVSHGSIYDDLLEAQGIKINEEVSSDGLLKKLKADDVMQSQVETLESNLTLEQVLYQMSNSHHRGFPVVENGELVGIITQSDLSKNHNLPSHTLLREIMTVKPMTISPEASLSDVLYLLNRYQLSRLPVTEERRLVGIITRTDIIRTEVNQISGNSLSSLRGTPSYLVYRTCAPAIGKGRILLPLANPKTAPGLLKMAAAIASYYDYELECLQVIAIPKHKSPARTRISSSRSLELMGQLEELEADWQIAIHTQIRVAHDPALAILEAIQERHIDLVLMGCKGNSVDQKTIFGHIAEILIRDAPCDLILVKLSSFSNRYPYRFRNNSTWLFPFNSGQNSEKAISFLPALTNTNLPNYHPLIFLSQVRFPGQSSSDFASLHATSQILLGQTNLKIVPVPIFAPSVAEGVIKLAKRENCEVVVLGISKEGFFERALHGNIPETIARGVDATVILVREN